MRVFFPELLLLRRLHLLIPFPLLHFRPDACTALSASPSFPRSIWCSDSQIAFIVRLSVLSRYRCRRQSPPQFQSSDVSWWLSFSITRLSLRGTTTVQRRRRRRTTCRSCLHLCQPTDVMQVMGCDSERSRDITISCSVVCHRAEGAGFSAFFLPRYAETSGAEVLEVWQAEM
ncbi:hypothetical protein C8J56DRAFT_81364 [Mycena floridula]|nr:hypothetical protein C8J56DRAFT_81364 [Mycena floridula]